MTEETKSPVWDKLVAFQKTYEELKRISAQELIDAFREEVDPLFLAWPGLQVIKWNQYTPYFNDGDPCVFHRDTIWYETNSIQQLVHNGAVNSYGGWVPVNDDDGWRLALETGDDLPCVRESLPEMPLWNDPNRQTWNANRHALIEAEKARLLAVDRSPLNIAELVGQTSATLEGFPDTAYEFLGDHLSVYLTRTGAYTEHYDHD